MISESLKIVQDLIAVRYSGADANTLLARCDAWLARREAEEQSIRDSRFRVSHKLDMLDKASDRVRAVRLNCLHIINSRWEAA